MKTRSNSKVKPFISLFKLFHMGWVHTFWMLSLFKTYYQFLWSYYHYRSSSTLILQNQVAKTGYYAYSTDSDCDTIPLPAPIHVRVYLYARTTRSKDSYSRSETRSVCSYKNSYGVSPTPILIQLSRAASTTDVSVLVETSYLSWYELFPNPFFVLVSGSTSTTPGCIWIFLTDDKEWWFTDEKRSSR